MWGEGSKNYSEEVIKSYICRHGQIVMQRRMNNQLSIVNLAAIHVGGSSNNTKAPNRQFGARVASLLTRSKFKIFFSYNYLLLVY